MAANAFPAIAQHNPVAPLMQGSSWTGFYTGSVTTMLARYWEKIYTSRITNAGFHLRHHSKARAGRQVVFQFTYSLTCPAAHTPPGINIKNPLFGHNRPPSHFPNICQCVEIRTGVSVHQRVILPHNAAVTENITRTSRI